MENDSLKKDLVKRDILEAIASSSQAAPHQNDVSSVLTRLKQVIEQIEGDLNSEANKILKKLSIVLSEKKPETAQSMLVRQETYIISRDEACDDSSPKLLSTGKDYEKNIYEKLTEAFKNFDIKDKVIVVLIEPPCKHVPTEQRLSSNRSSNLRPQTSRLSNMSPLSKDLRNPRRTFSVTSLNTTPQRSPARNGFVRPNQDFNQKKTHLRSSISSSHINRRSLSPNSSVRSCPIYSKGNPIMKGTKIPTPQKLTNSTRNLSGSGYGLNSIVKQQRGALRPTTICHSSRSSPLLTPEKIYGVKSPYRGATQKIWK